MAILRSGQPHRLHASSTTRFSCMRKTRRPISPSRSLCRSAAVPTMTSSALRGRRVRARCRRHARDRPFRWHPEPFWWQRRRQRQRVIPATRHRGAGRVAAPREPCCPGKPLLGATRGRRLAGAVGLSRGLCQHCYLSAPVSLSSASGASSRACCGDSARTSIIMSPLTRTLIVVELPWLSFSR